MRFLKSHSVISTFLFIPVLIGCASHQKTADELIAKGYKQLSTEEIGTVLAGNTLHGTFRHPTYGSSSVTVYIGKDGSIVGETSVGTQKRDTGNWEARPGNLFCDRYRTWQGGYDCDWVYVRGNEFVLVNKDGTISTKGQIEKGNSRGL